MTLVQTKSLEDIRDELLRGKEFETDIELYAYANGILDMYLEVKKSG